MFWKTGRAAILTVVLLAGSSISQARGGTLYGNSLDGTLYQIDPATGAATGGISTGLTSLLGIAFNSSGTLFGLTTLTGTPTANALYQINPATGVSSLVGETGLSNIFEGDLAFNSTGTLYGIQDASGTDSRELFAIDTTTGHATIVGSISTMNSDYSGLAFDSSGKLFALDTQNSLLVELDPLTAAVIATVSIDLTLGDVAGLTFDPATGQAYVADGGVGGTNSLYTLDVTTGALTLVGVTGVPGGIAGLSFGPTAAAIPEPSSFILGGIAFSTVGLFATRRARRR